jgi:hypothetical protein
MGKRSKSNKSIEPNLPIDASESGWKAFTSQPVVPIESRTHSRSPLKSKRRNADSCNGPTLPVDPEERGWQALLSKPQVKIENTKTPLVYPTPPGFSKLHQRYLEMDKRCPLCKCHHSCKISFKEHFDYECTQRADFYVVIPIPDIPGYERLLSIFKHDNGACPKCYYEMHESIFKAHLAFRCGKPHAKVIDLADRIYERPKKYNKFAEYYVFSPKLCCICEFPTVVGEDYCYHHL